MEVVVTGIGLTSALGNLHQSWKKLLEGKSAIKLHQPFAELPPLPLGLINFQPVNLTQLTKEVVETAVKSSGLTLPLHECGVVIGSSRGYQGMLEKLAKKQLIGDGQQNDLEKDDTSFINLLPHQPAIFAASQIGTKGAVLAPMAACATGIWAIARAVELIETGQCQQVIAGAVESPITPLSIAGFRKMGALAQTGAYPFDRSREGLVLGEGAAVLVLESAEFARQRAAKIYGQIRGFGLTNDATYGNAPDLSGKSAMLAIAQCLERSGLSAEDIDYVHAHGTATQLNDRHEANLIEQIFSQGVAVSSTKGATGHTLGASGALGAAFCLMAIEHQILPPCVGLNEAEFDLDLVRYARQSQVKNVLCLSFGFGGQNAVLVLASGN
ncbi:MULTISPECIES: beta-ketoacyl-ACP synthase [unclassified Okeania]|uniref:beta-ketoacyl-ACP synthase n=1 Tax=unclassified Okeania TaxID=2634635 RepID=UPI0013BA781C|nr:MULTISPECIES: beta-ketoacyl-ACP synthase [unclassified Okeania]NES79734.1 beta-ketoacyl-ACP synthase [Okeania sp. SIO1H4]NET15620.1 beta-ketoacyl-ACP synthase [Okeania sp. SIO1H6]NET23425.1 beta-ketoacyl-ACP synthase [Okeania sp. SIO1H5]NET97111.1 beta-ketoacyl-ACP synthase [Okeania sp. SIO1H2]